MIEEDFPNVSPIALVEQAARLMRDNSLHALPVVEGKGLRGVIACEDIVYRGIADGEDWFFAHVEDYMTRNPNVALNTDDNSSLIALMKAGRHKWLPIITANREYLGVIKLAVLERFAPDMESAFP
ncbi:CBS domain-containing protein [Qipengyuania aurantiaca]|uniref:CBS domain-containing protein n=1 Tax=Qipengyuania aurantiaca TaxID=2867233 RepID=A0ABX8ZQV3_9SPHN|nr:CBS domain-containing protein [Qipengyuania aurantiaca]QZD90013.1 CBS domain-containing protein [Qipengyuania aurantiaca]